MYKRNVMEHKKISGNKIGLRIRDKHGHFLCKVENGYFYIYCKRCKELYKLRDLLKQNYDSRRE